MMKHELKNSVDHIEEKSLHQSASGGSSNSSTSGLVSIIHPSCKLTTNSQDLHHQHLSPITAAADIANSLSYNCLSNNLTSGSKTHHHKHHRTLGQYHFRNSASGFPNIDEYNSYNYLHDPSVSLTSHRSYIMHANQHHHSQSKNKKQPNASNDVKNDISGFTQNQDPLAHIYETISISSSFNTPASQQKSVIIFERFKNYAYKRHMRKILWDKLSY